MAVDDDHARPTGTDSLLPQQLRRMVIPVGNNRHAGHNPVALWPTELGTISRLNRPALFGVAPDVAFGNTARRLFMACEEETFFRRCPAPVDLGGLICGE